LSSVPRRRNNAQCSTKRFSRTDTDTVTDTGTGTGTVPGTDADDGDFDNDDGDFDNDDGDFDNDDGDFDNDDGDGDNDHAGAAANFDSSHASPRATFCRWHSCRR